MNPPGKTSEQIDEEMERRTATHMETNAHKILPDSKKSIYSTSGRRSPRRSRLTFLSPSMFPPTVRGPEPTPVRINDEAARSPPSRKLRKTRSNPQLSGASQSSATRLPQTTGHTGRGHSQSVTAADIPRYPISSVEVPALPLGDIFAQVMRWDHSTPPSTASQVMTSNHHDEEEGSSSTSISEPFGPRVVFDSPSRPSESYLNAPPLREVQSFESGLTARADPTPRPPKMSMLSPITASLYAKSSPSTPPEPATPAQTVVSQSSDSRPSSVDRGYTPSVETLQYTRYSTEVFDVIQTYRGLPLLDRIAPYST